MTETKKQRRTQSQSRHYPRGPVVRLEIDEDMIRVSKKADSGHCMIADALKSAVPDAKTISVDLQTIRFSDPKKGLRYTYLTPRIGQVNIVKFDMGSRNIEPFTMTLKGAHVTASQSRTKEQKARTRGEPPKKKKLRSDKSKVRVKVLTPVGGKPPPTSKMKDGVPFNRRRSYGLRGLEVPED